MEKCIIEYDKKIEMFEKCIFPVLKIYNNQLNELNITRERKEILSDGKRALEKYLKDRKFDYSLAFFVSFSLAKNYLLLVEKIKNGEIVLENLKNEEYWDRGEIEENISLFFLYSFINEVFGKILSIDMYQISKSAGIHRAYLSLRSELV